MPCENHTRPWRRWQFDDFVGPSIFLAMGYDAMLVPTININDGSFTWTKLPASTIHLDTKVTAQVTRGKIGQCIVKEHFAKWKCPRNQHPIQTTTIRCILDHLGASWKPLGEVLQLWGRLGGRPRSGTNPILEHGLYRIPAQAPCVFWQGFGPHVFGPLGGSGAPKGSSWRGFGGVMADARARGLGANKVFSKGFSKKQCFFKRFFHHYWGPLGDVLEQHPFFSLGASWDLLGDLGGVL